VVACAESCFDNDILNHFSLEHWPSGHDDADRAHRIEKVEWWTIEDRYNTQQPG